MQSVLKGFVTGYPDRREVTASVEKYVERLGTKSGKPFKWADDGDWVFWPVE